MSDKKEVIYPSQYGSHASMVDADATEKLNNPDMVVCRDKYGPYTTLKSRLDTNLADPNRYAASRAIVIPKVEKED